MPKTPLKLLDVVALLVDKPQDRLVTGQVGTVVELLAPDVYEVGVPRLEGAHHCGDRIKASGVVVAAA